MDEEKNAELYDMLKRIQVGDHLDMDEVELFESDKIFLKAARTFFLEVTLEAKFLSKNPSPRMVKERQNKCRSRLSELLKKKEKGEDKDKFPSTKFFESRELAREDVCILMLLLARRGVGLRLYSKRVPGEELILSLKLLLDVDPEDARMKLTRASRLIKDGYVHVISHRRRSIRSSYREVIEPHHSVEDMEYVIADWVVDSIYGGELAKKKDTEKKEKRVVKEVKSEVEFSHVILPPRIKEPIMSLLEQYNNKEKFMNDWNMRSILGERKGLNLLLSGAPGTGKTMLAKALSNELDADLYILSFPDMVDCWYGNTEKNASMVFDSVGPGSILLIDEADAVLQRRSPSRYSCDRSENRIVNIFLQGLENHDGVMIFTTNVAVGLDRAMERRLDLKLELPIPDVGAREDIWRYHIPDELPLAEDVDISMLAEKYRFTGGQIRNAVVNAARHAMRSNSEEVKMEDFVTACQQEVEGSEVMDFYMGRKEEEEVRGYY
ncbi:MAG: ATP-binding protein [Thermoplasmata archaeon]